MNAAITLDDLFSMYNKLVNQGFTPNTLMMNQNIYKDLGIKVLIPENHNNILPYGPDGPSPYDGTLHYFKEDVYGRMNVCVPENNN